MTLIIFFCVFLLIIAALVFFRIYHSGKYLKGKNYLTNCNVCGKPSVSWKKQFCSFECEAQLAQNMPNLYQQFDLD